MSTKSTKAQLEAHISVLDAQLASQAQGLRALREQLSMAASAPALPHGRATHADYYAYVAEQRLVARTTGQRVCSYKTYNQWSAA